MSEWQHSREGNGECYKIRTVETGFCVLKCGEHPIEPKGGEMNISKLSKCTPGPWEVRNKRSVHPVGRDALAVAVAEQHDANCEANARLIAAAPDLLEVLERALEHSNCPGENCAIDWHARAKVVIAKAKGGAK